LAIDLAISILAGLSRSGDALLMLGMDLWIVSVKTLAISRFASRANRSAFLVDIIGEGDGDLGTHKLAAMLLIILLGESSFHFNNHLFQELSLDTVNLAEITALIGASQSK
jgi:hypothetical protein